ncbi:MAG: hypothetical protein N2235_04745 [Fischerella sp.]|nr:hypothetical protein [Fischerella sp.]
MINDKQLILITTKEALTTGVDYIHPETNQTPEPICLQTKAEA